MFSSKTTPKPSRCIGRLRAAATRQHFLRSGAPIGTVPGRGSITPRRRAGFERGVNSHRRLTELYEIGGDRLPQDLERALFHHAIEAQLFAAAGYALEAAVACARRRSLARALAGGCRPDRPPSCALAAQRIVARRAEKRSAVRRLQRRRGRSAECALRAVPPWVLGSVPFRNRPSWPVKACPGHPWTCGTSPRVAVRAGNVPSVTCWFATAVAASHLRALGTPFFRPKPT